MVVVSGTVRIQPQRHAEARELFSWLQEHTRAEAGNLSYRFYEAIEDANLMHVFEEWEDEGALAAHFQTPHMAELGGRLGPLVAEAPQLTRYEVSAHAPLPL